MSYHHSRVLLGMPGMADSLPTPTSCGDHLLLANLARERSSDSHDTYSVPTLEI
jgi:hypothetical protein